MPLEAEKGEGDKELPAFPSSILQSPTRALHGLNPTGNPWTRQPGKCPEQDTGQQGKAGSERKHKHEWVALRSGMELAWPVCRKRLSLGKKKYGGYCGIGVQKAWPESSVPL
jgi:hypothetical protein